MRYLVREVFHCGRGKVPELLEYVKAVDQQMTDAGLVNNSRICVDVTGRFDTLVYEGEAESLDAAFGAERAIFANQDEHTKPVLDGMNATTVAGYREVYEIVS